MYHSAAHILYFSKKCRRNEISVFCMFCYFSDQVFVADIYA